MKKNHLFPIYKPFPIKFLSGNGAFLKSYQGDYLDFASGIATNVLGYNHPALKKALEGQISTGIIHLSNLCTISQQQKASELLVRATCMDRVFFANSGTEAVECAIKTARNFQYSQGRRHRYRIASLEGCFHGRTMASLAATHRMTKNFGPKPEGFFSISRKNLLSLEKVLSRKDVSTIAALILEPIQGEGGVHIIEDECLRAIRTFCTKNDILLILDEIQCGNGRTGDFLASHRSGIVADILCLAKGIAGGFPVGACLSKDAIACTMALGMHGSTFGGNPLAMAATISVVEVLTDPSFLKHVREIGEVLQQKLQKLHGMFSTLIVSIRGRGLMLGLEIASDWNNLSIVQSLRENGLLVVAASDNVIRLLPPLIIQKKHVEQCYDLLLSVFESLYDKQQQSS